MRGEPRCEGSWIPNPDDPYQVAETLRMRAVINVGLAHCAAAVTEMVASAVGIMGRLSPVAS
jgi:hypothetical protein